VSRADAARSSQFPGTGVAERHRSRPYSRETKAKPGKTKKKNYRKFLLDGLSPFFTYLDEPISGKVRATRKTVCIRKNLPCFQRIIPPDPNNLPERNRI
jgi:hypothetical protein